MFKIEIRKDCKVCHKPLPTSRHRTYCSKECRTHALNQRHRQQQTEWQRNKRDAEASRPSKDKIQCLICGKWYRQVGTHIVQVHKMTAREYRLMLGFDVKRGQLPDDLRQLKREQVFENETVKNLKAGKKFRFKKGQPGVGVYTRSIQTLERLKTKHKSNNYGTSKEM